MAKTILFVSGPLNVTGDSNTEVIQNPSSGVVANPQDMPETINVEDLIVREPGSTKAISMKALAEKMKAKEE